MDNLSHEIIDYFDDINMHYNIYTAYELYNERHWHQGIEIVYVVKGQLRVYVNDNEYLLDEKCFSVINSMEIHATKHIGETTILLLQIPHTAIPKTDRINCRNHYDEEISKIIERLISIYQNKEKGYYLEFNSVVFDMLHKIFLKFGQINVNQDVILFEDKEYITKIGQVIDYVQEHYMDVITLDDVSSLACYNKQYFTRIFKKHMKITFLEYLNSVRIRHIFDELIYTDTSISEIAERNGFTNNKNFQKSFKKSYGCTPSEMRKRYREDNKNS
ncbi:MAG: AraC family transcriptional regulator [Oscillospiraceae bacterium]